MHFKAVSFLSTLYTFNLQKYSFPFSAHATSEIFASLLTLPTNPSMHKISWFSLLGKLADRAIYFACVNFFLF